SSTSRTPTWTRGFATRDLGAPPLMPPAAHHPDSRMTPAASVRPGRLLEVEDLRVTFPTEDGLVRAVDGISYAVDTGRTLGIVGESGSGKSVSSLTTLGLTRTQGAEIAGEILFEGQDLVSMSDDQL